MRFKSVTVLLMVAGLAAACYRHRMDEPIDAISPFTLQEVEAAIALVAPASDAQRIAVEIHAISMEERREYGWTEYAIALLAMVSPATLDKVQRVFGGTAEEWLELGRGARTFREAGHVSEGMGIEDFVVK